MAEQCKKKKISTVGIRRGYDRDYIIISNEVCRGVIRRIKLSQGSRSASAAM